MFGGAVFLVGLSFLDCTMTGLAVALLTVAVAVTGSGLAGFWVNHMDIAPRYSGTLMGISNGLAAVSGFIAPSVAAALTKDVSHVASCTASFFTATCLASAILKAAPRRRYAHPVICYTDEHSFSAGQCFLVAVYISQTFRFSGITQLVAAPH